MRIRPATVTATGSFVAIVAIATIVLSTTPDEAGGAQFALLWAAVFLAVLGMCTTLLLLIRSSVPQAVWASLFPAVAVLWSVKSVQQGVMTHRLLAIIVLATLVLSFFIWMRLRPSRNHD